MVAIISSSPLESMLDFVKHVELNEKRIMAKINTKSKMQRTNNKVRAWMEANGYRCIYFFPHSRFSKDYHITHSKIIADFDGIAIKENRIVFFQCKTNCKALKKTIKEYKILEAIFGIELIWFNAIDRKGLELNNCPAEDYSPPKDFFH